MTDLLAKAGEVIGARSKGEPWFRASSGFVVADINNVDDVIIADCTYVVDSQFIAFAANTMESYQKVAEVLACYYEHVDNEGMVSPAWEGLMNKAMKELDEAIAKALGDKP
jgi:hypothetical protein